MALDGSIKCIFNNDEVNIPKELLESRVAFESIFSEDTWRKLDASERSHLSEFLPVFPSESSRKQYETLREIFGGSGAFKYGNPIKVLYDQIVGGQLLPDVVKLKMKCKRAKYKNFKLMRKEYYKEIVQQILIARQRILDQAKRHGAGYIGQIRNQETYETESLDERVKKKYQRILRDVKQEVQDSTLSSDDEDMVSSLKERPPTMSSSHFGVHHSLFGPPPPSTLRKPYVAPFPCQAPFMGMVPGNPYPYMAPSRHLGDGNHQQSGMVDSEYRTVLERHRKRRICNENHPELDTSDTTLADIITRANPAKKVKNTKKGKDSGKQTTKAVKVKKKLKTKPKEQMPLKIKEEPREVPVIKEEPIEPIPPPQHSNVLPEPSVPESKPRAKLPEDLQFRFGCFFSLLRGLFKDNDHSVCTVDQVKEKVRAWQMNDSIHPEEWTKLTVDWIELVPPALKYLAGEGKATLIQDFVPLVTMTENPKEWKWTGHGFDDDDILTSLCAHWLDTVNKPEENDSFFQSNLDASESLRDEQSSMSKTSQERQEFIEQERKRYENPHKPYTYHSNGTTSVVGAVKGVFHKESGFSKAREHALLVSNRPAYVTILSLVKDAVARLPNGEGTRAEVCRLLKDSQFINPEASDAQIHTVVSGALDRLHAERDPCVKYDITRKVWIYLHRHRTEGEFERIHQASAAASLAKKQYTQRQKSVKQKKALQDLVDQQEKSSRETNADSKPSNGGHVTKKCSKKPKQHSQADGGNRGEKTKTVLAKEQATKTPPEIPGKQAKLTSSSVSQKKDMKTPPVARHDVHQQRKTDSATANLGSLSEKTIVLSAKTKSEPGLVTQSLPLKAPDPSIPIKMKLPFAVSKPLGTSMISETKATEIAVSRDKVPREELPFPTVSLESGGPKILSDVKTDSEAPQVNVPGSITSTPIAVRAAANPINPVLNIVPPHCAAAKFVRLPFSHGAAITSAIQTQPAPKTQTVTKYSAVHLPNPSSSVLITVPQHPDRVAPLRISLPRANIGTNINVSRGIPSPATVDFTRTARPGVILSRMATPIGSHQRIYVRQLSHESLQAQSKSQSPVVTTASK